MRYGTVMERTGNEAVLLTPEGEFVRVKVRGDVQVGEETAWTERDRVRGKNGSVTRGWRRISAVASAVVLLLVVFALWNMRTPPVVAYVSMDVNPSIEFGLDAKERVRELRALNDDAVVIVGDLAYRGRPIEEVLRLVAQRLSDARILKAGEGEIVIASVRLRAVDAEWETQVTEKMKQVLLQASEVLQSETAGKDAPDADAGGAGDGGTGLEIETFLLPAEIRDEAEANGISPGKMAFWLAAQSGGHDMPINELQTQSVKTAASSWGGLKKVLADSEIAKADKDEWKQLLKELKAQQKAAAKQARDQEKQEKPNGKDKGNSNSAEKSKDDDKGKGKEDDKDKGKDDKDKGKESDKGKDDKDKGKESDKGKDDKDKGKEDNKGKDKDKDKDKDRDKDKEKDKGSNNGKGQLKDRGNDRASSGPPDRGDEDGDHDRD